jgi:prepilin-type N-terminal cleavage/methylation domain-containing protein
MRSDPRRRPANVRVGHNLDRNTLQPFRAATDLTVAETADGPYGAPDTNEGRPTMISSVSTRSAKGRDKGFTLVELLIVIVILGILATVTVFAVRGITDKGKAASCGSDRKTVETAIEAYFAQYSATSIAHTGTDPATGGTAIAAPTGVTAGAKPENTLVSSKLIRDVSPNYDVKDDGTLLVKTQGATNGCTLTS